jgi:hypothetical protein
MRKEGSKGDSNFLRNGWNWLRGANQSADDNLRRREYWMGGNQRKAFQYPLINSATRIAAPGEVLDSPGNPAAISPPRGGT